MSSLAQNALTEMSMSGNPVTITCAFRLKVAAKMPQLSFLDGYNLSRERAKLQDLTKKWYPSSGLSVRDCNLRDPLLSESTRVAVEPKTRVVEVTTRQNLRPEFPVRVMTARPAASSRSARSLHATGFRTSRRNTRY